MLHGSTSGITTNKSSIVLEKDLFVCSEYERSAAALSIAKSNVEAMLADKDFLEVNHLTSFAPMIKSLSDSVHKTFDNLMHKIQSHLEHYFSKASTTTTNTSSGSTDQTSVETEIELRCFAHCLRALIYINQGHIAEECLARTVLEPYLK